MGVVIGLVRRPSCLTTAAARVGGVLFIVMMVMATAAARAIRAVNMGATHQDRLAARTAEGQGRGKRQGPFDFIKVFHKGFLRLIAEFFRHSLPTLENRKRVVMSKLNILCLGGVVPR